MKIYRACTSAPVKNFVRSVDSFCANNLPTIHEKFFLPFKAAAKSALLKFSMTHDTQEEPPAESPAESFEKNLNFWKLSTQEDFSPLVSVVVPNYNHAPYLRERLETIYAQTYKNFEVILLDDASTDESRNILREFQQLHANNTRLIFNEKNSGGVFNQWRKGLGAARGDLIWIAESDDFSAENFLSELVPAFADETIQLAFCRTDFIQDGQKIFTTEEYLSDMREFGWNKSFAMTSAEFVPNGLAIKNVIPNVSSVVFRRPKNIREELLELWRDMKLCGDWAFYLDVLKGGCVYYSPAATNFYRVHKQSTSLKIQKKPRYFLEHQKIAEFVARNYNVPAEAHEAHKKKLEEHFLGYYGGKDLNELDKLFDVEKILRIKRKPSILMGVFSMSIGGGETFPLILANELKRRDYPVTVLDYQMSDDLPDIRKKLDATIPLVRLKKTDGLAEVVKQFKPDLIHTHHGSVDEATSYVVEKFPNLRHVVTLHGMYEETEEKYLPNLLCRTGISVSAFVYIAEKNLKPFREHNFGREEIFHKIGNGLEREPINPIPRAELAIPENSFVACVVSRAIPEKGWQPAIDAVTLANSQSGRRIDLLLVGAGVMYDKLNGNVPEFVHLTGFKSNVRDYLAAADIGLLPSEYAGESFPLLIIDSFFAGRPVVSSNLGEVKSMVGNAGIVFNLVDGKVLVATLAEILRELADNPAAYEKIFCRVDEQAEKFSIENVAEKYIAIYNAVR